jgi:hypothetical protein
LVIAQIILFSWWFSEKKLNKKINKKDLIKMVKSKMTYLEWHFGQVRHGGKKTIYMGFFLLKFHIKKAVISCGETILMRSQLLEGLKYES